MQGANAASSERANYLDEIRRFPMLKAEEECLLAQRWRDDGDARAAHRLLTSHLRLVAKVAMGYRRYGLSTSDLISEGTRSGEGCSVLDLCGLVDQGGDSRLRPALVVAR
jgi:RNA polymerase sigma-32 factor